MQTKKPIKVLVKLKKKKSYILIYNDFYESLV